jgi:aminoglycoside phosphotransferase (APT) family kinase protein
VGTGRSADVFEHGSGEVMRRYRRPRDTEREVAAMEHARANGFPAPAARALNDTEIVMERVDGPTMLTDLTLRPWRLGSHASTLAALHDRLHAIPGPPWLPAPLGDGESLLHLDLHPDNVMLSKSGPVVIDWPNAARGPAPADIAHTWLVLAFSLPPAGGLRRAGSAAGRRLYLYAFLRQIGAERAQIEALLPAAAAYRRGCRALPERERAALARVAPR